MKRTDIRLINLKILIKEAGSAANLAKKADTDPAYLSQLLSQRETPKGTKRGVGDKLARKLEIATKKPEGWMDFVHNHELTLNEPQTEYNVDNNSDLMDDVLDAIAEHLDKTGDHWSREKIWQEAQELYEIFSNQKHWPTRSNIIRMIDYAEHKTNTG